MPLETMYPGRPLILLALLSLVSLLAFCLSGGEPSLHRQLTGEAVVPGQSTCRPNPKYHIILDAGSTGTRVNLFKYRTSTSMLPGSEKSDKGSYQVECKNTKWRSLHRCPLENLPSYLEEIWLEMVALLEKHADAGPEYVKLDLFATAGMRHLRATDASLVRDMMSSVHTFLSEKCANYTHTSNPSLKINFGEAKTIDGKEEAIGSWVDANTYYRSQKCHAVGIIEIGGHSFQIQTHPTHRLCLTNYGTNSGLETLAKHLSKSVTLEDKTVGLAGAPELQAGDFNY